MPLLLNKSVRMIFMIKNRPFGLFSGEDLGSFTRSDAMDRMQEFVKEPESSALIRFQDCDPFGHLNNARYIDYFFNARQDHLAKFYDFHIFEHGKTPGENWVVTKTQIAYLFPAQVSEEVLIKTHLVHFTESTIVVEGIMFDKNMKRPKAVIWTEFTYVSLTTGRTKQH